MSPVRIPESTRPAAGERPDLGREYRPIGIGAVAAAVAVANTSKGSGVRSDPARAVLFEAG